MEIAQHSTRVKKCRAADPRSHLPRQRCYYGHGIPLTWICVQLEDSQYQLIADYNSNYQFVEKVPKGKSSSKALVDITKQILKEQVIFAIVSFDNVLTMNDKHMNMPSDMSLVPHVIQEATGLSRSKSELEKE